MVFKCQKLCLTLRKFYKTLLAFKMPKCGIFVTNIGILNAKKKHLKCPYFEISNTKNGV